MPQYHDFRLLLKKLRYRAFRWKLQGRPRLVRTYCKQPRRRRHATCGSSDPPCGLSTLSTCASQAPGHGLQPLRRPTRNKLWPLRQRFTRQRLCSRQQNRGAVLPVVEVMVVVVAVVVVVVVVVEVVRPGAGGTKRVRRCVATGMGRTLTLQWRLLFEEIVATRSQLAVTLMSKGPLYAIMGRGDARSGSSAGVSGGSAPH